MPLFIVGGILVAVVATLWWHSVPIVSSLPVVGTSTAAVVRSDEVEEGSPAKKEETITSDEDWRAWFPLVEPMTIGEVPVLASVAATAPERMQGLSGTPYLPPEVVKLFVFPVPGYYGFWMKDMRYPIDIMWVDAAGFVVHIEHDVAPETYPLTLMPAAPALYVIETVAGFARKHQVTVGTPVQLPTITAR